MKELDHVQVGRTQTSGVVSRSAQLAGFGREIPVGEHSPHREIELVEKWDPSGTSEDDPFAKCLSIFPGLRRNDEAAVRSSEVARHHQKRSPANRDGDLHRLTHKPAQQAVENGAANHFRGVAIAAGKGSWIVNLRRPNQFTFMDRCEMLHVEGVGGVHVPIAIGDIAEQPAADIFRRIFSKEKGEWKQRLSTVEEKYVTVSLGDGIGSQAGKRWDTFSGRAGNMFAHSICSIAPAVERALNGFADNLATAEVGAQVRAVCVHDGKFPARGSKRHQLASQDLLRKRTLLHLRAGPEQVPARRIFDKLIGRGCMTCAN